MNILKFSLLSIAVSLLMWPNTSLAANLRIGNEVNISAEEEISKNIYIASGISDVNSVIKGDLTILSSESHIKGVIEKDLNIVGADVLITGEIKDDLRVLGGNVVVEGVIGGDTVVVGGDVHLKDTSSINGDILIVGGKLILDSKLENFSKIVAGHVTINNVVNGDAEITTQQLIISDKSEINGNIKYFSPSKAQQSDGAVINTDLQFNQISSIKDSNLFKKVVLSFINFWILLRFITTLLLAFLLVYVFKVFSQKVSDYSLDHFGKSLLIGIISIVIVPIISALLFISLIALPISILLVISYFFIVVISSAVAGIILGTLIQKVVKKEEEDVEVNFHTTTIGVIILTVLQFVPVVGELTRIIFIIVAIGAVIRYVYSSIRFSEKY